VDLFKAMHTWLIMDAGDERDAMPCTAWLIRSGEMKHTTGNAIKSHHDA
jgi:hypothetical protein